MDKNKAILSSIIGATLMLFVYVMITSFTATAESNEVEESKSNEFQLVGTMDIDYKYMNIKN